MRTAWLAGLLDGEGSVGITITACTRGGKRAYRLVAMVQVSMTCKHTIDEVISVMHAIGVRASRYSYREKDPTKHKDAHYVHVGRLLDIRTLGEAVAPFSVTKRKHWELMLVYARSRLSRAKIDALGRVVRGGHLRDVYTENEIAIARALRALNARGPGAERKQARWLQKIEQLRRA